MKTLVVVAALLCVSCGTFQLGNVHVPADRTKDQAQLDILTCKDQAHLETDKAENQVKDFLLGLTIIGAPVAYEKDKATQREVFAKCMGDRGYRVDPPSDNPKATSVSSSPSANSTQGSVAATGEVRTAQPDLKSAPATGQAASPRTEDVAAQLEKLKSWFERGLITEDEYKKKRSEILDRV
jgi:hypothetical protein